MYPGFPLSNILESQSNNIRNILYQPHYSVYDLCMLDTELSFHTIDQNAKIFFDPKSSLVVDNNDTLYIRSYSLFVTNNAMLSLKNNIATSMHLNSIFVCHDQNLLQLKKEDAFLVCQNSIRQNDVIYSYPVSMSKFVCNKIPNHVEKYCIPEILGYEENNERTKIGLFCYNKQLPDHYLSQTIGLGPDISVDNLNKIPTNIEDARSIFNNYKAVVEIDSGSIINVLWAIKCGCIGIIIDNNNMLQQYRSIPNLYIVENIQELSNIINNLPEYKNKEFSEDMFIGLAAFKQNMMSTFQQISKKVFIL